MSVLGRNLPETQEGQHGPGAGECVALPPQCGGGALLAAPRFVCEQHCLVLTGASWEVSELRGPRVSLVSRVRLRSFAG